MRKFSQAKPNGAHRGSGDVLVKLGLRRHIVFETNLPGHNISQTIPKGV
jgi:hypothetical protein